MTCSRCQGLMITVEIDEARCVNCGHHVFGDWPTAQERPYPSRPRTRSDILMQSRYCEACGSDEGVERGLCAACRQIETDVRILNRKRLARRSLKIVSTEFED